MSGECLKNVSCPCDVRAHPPGLAIDAGLPSIPRQLADFPQWRNAMLAGIATKAPLRQWRARGVGDLGVMLIEMGAYVFDVCSFYDETIAHESYLRTARQRSSLRGLTALLGYLPRPAVGSQVKLAAVAAGPQPVKLPAGTAFRSGAFGDEPPQVYELEADQTIDADNNSWEVKRPRRTIIGDTLGFDPATYRVARGRKAAASQTATEAVANAVHDAAAQGMLLDQSEITRIRESTYQSFGITELPVPLVTQELLLVPGTVRLERGDLVVIEWEFEGAQSVHIRKVTDIASVTKSDGQKYVRMTLGEPVEFPVFVELAAIRIRKPTAKALITAEPEFLPKSTPVFTGSEFIWLSLLFPQLQKITLDRVYPQIRSGHRVILERDGKSRWYDVKHSEDIKIPVMEAAAVGAPFEKIASIIGPATQLTLHVPLNTPDGIWTLDDLSSIAVYYGLVDAAEVTVEANSHLSPVDELELAPPATPVVEQGRSRSLLLQDGKLNGKEIVGTLESDPPSATAKIVLDHEYDWSPDLASPVKVFGNVVGASRGATVVGEIFGSGDSATPNQGFELKKKPLTYLPGPVGGTTSGVASTLSVYVDGVRWSEIRNFFDATPDARVYIVRHDDEGEAIVTFGDGRNGARVPTGVDNITATYRFGAGRASPPAGSITQIAKPVKGLASVANPVAAGGGDDAEDREHIRSNAPASALLLGRAVSLPDMEAVVSQVPGVRVAKAEWRWSERKQRPVAQIWYVGSAQLETVSGTVRNVVDPTTPIAVTPADAKSAELRLGVRLNPEHLPEKVKHAIVDALLNSDDGLLLPETLGIGGAVFRSRLSDRVLTISGVEAVTSIEINGKQLESAGISPEAGCYFDFESGGVIVE